MTCKKLHIELTKFYAMSTAMGIVGLQLGAVFHGSPGVELLLDPLHALHVAYDPVLMLPDTSGLYPPFPWLYPFACVTIIVLSLLGFVTSALALLGITAMQYARVILAPVVDLLTPNRYDGGRK